MIKRVSVFLILALAVCMTVGGATIAWKGQTWDVVGDGNAVINGDGSITLAQNSNTEVDLVLNTMFTTASVAYLDNPGANIDMFQQSISNVHNPRIQDGSAFGCCSGIGYERYDNGPAVESVVYFDLTPRTLGAPHTVSTKLYADGAVDHVFDGVLTQGTFLKTNVGSFGEFEQLLLRLRSVNADHRLQQATFTDFQLGGSPVPEPSSYALMGIGFLGLLLWKNRHKMPKLSFKQCASALMIVLAITAIAVPATAAPIVTLSQNGGPAQNVTVNGGPDNWFINDLVLGLTVVGVFGGVNPLDYAISVAGANMTSGNVDYELLVIQAISTPPALLGINTSLTLAGSAFPGKTPKLSNGSLMVTGNPGAMNLGASISGLACTGPVGSSTSCNSANSNPLASILINSMTSDSKWRVGTGISFTTSSQVSLLQDKAQVPEPATFALAGLGLCVVAFARRKRRQNQ